MYAVMGLASLENCAVAITCRDDFIGWTLSKLVEKIKEGAIATLATYQRLIAYLNEGIASIDYSDLCSNEDIQNPSASVIEKLNTTAVDSENQRKTLIESNGTTSYSNEYLSENDVARSDESVALLFRHKRAEQMSKNLVALAALRSAISRTDFDAEWEKISYEESVATAIRIAKIKAHWHQYAGTECMWCCSSV